MKRFIDRLSEAVRVLFGSARPRQAQTTPRDAASTQRLTPPSSPHFPFRDPALTAAERAADEEARRKARAEGKVGFYKGWWEDLGPAAQAKLERDFAKKDPRIDELVRSLNQAAVVSAQQWEQHQAEAARKMAERATQETPPPQLRRSTSKPTAGK